MKLLMLFLLVTFASELTYQDSFGNEFVIENSQKLPKEIDFEFLKSNLNSTHFIKKAIQKTYGYKLTVIEIQKKAKNIYELKVRIKPQTKNDVEEILKYENQSYYVLKTRRTNNRLEIESVKFARGEI